MLSMLFIGIRGTVVALDRATGQEVWRTPLKGDFVNVVLLDGVLYATASGELFCLEPASGHIRWHNELKGLGRGLVTIATAGGQQVLPMRERQQQEEAAATAATSGAR